MDLRDLVVLKYAKNEHSTNVINIKDIKDEDFEINLEDKTWSYQKWKDVKIGQSRNIWDYGYRCKWGIIGVYNRKLTNHLDSMVHASKEFTESHAYSIVDD